jgi:hypothetical protein
MHEQIVHVLDVLGKEAHDHILVVGVPVFENGRPSVLFLSADANKRNAIAACARSLSAGNRLSVARLFRPAPLRWLRAIPLESRAMSAG